MLWKFHRGKNFLGDFLGKVNPESEVVFFNEKKYTRNKKSRFLEKRKYFYCTTKAGRALHRDVWELNNGPIPKGYVVHHIDHNPSNNDIKNLTVLSRSKHSSHHFDKEKMLKITMELCKTEKGKAQKIAAGRIRWRGVKYKKYKCYTCKKAFSSRSSKPNIKFCSSYCYGFNKRRTLGLKQKTCLRK